MSTKSEMTLSKTASSKKRRPYTPPKAKFVARNVENRLYPSASESSMACA